MQIRWLISIRNTGLYSLISKYLHCVGFLHIRSNYLLKTVEVSFPTDIFQILIIGLFPYFIEKYFLLLELLRKNLSEGLNPPLPRAECCNELAWFWESLVLHNILAKLEIKLLELNQLI